MTGMSWLSAAKLAICFLFVALTAGLVHNSVQQYEYPAPRFPSLALDPPTSVEEVMPYARQAARNRAAAFGGGLGLSTPGETIALVVGGCAQSSHSSKRCVARSSNEISRLWSCYEARVASSSLTMRPPDVPTRLRHVRENPTFQAMTITQAGFTEGARPGAGPVSEEDAQLA